VSGCRPLLLVGLLALGLASVASANGEVRVIGIDGSINPASVDFMIQTIESAERDGAAAVLIELNTPGGLVAATLDIVGAILNADVPVIVHVTPRGAMASSAGVFITMSAHIAAMAPSTTIGAAHPVSAMGANPKPPEPAASGDEEEEGEGSPPPAGGPADYSLQKIENVLAKYSETIAKERGRNVAWAEEALELGVIDLIVDSRSALIEAVEGRTISLKGVERVLSLSGATFVQVEMSFGQRFFDFLSDPNVASVLLLAGLLGLYIEFNNPGMIVPGVAGAVCLVLTAIAFQILPFSWVGLLVMVVGVGLMAAEVFVTSFGALFALGIACMLLGGSMVFDQPDVSDLNVSFWSVLVPAVAAFAVFGGLVVFALGRSLWVEQTAGVDELIGLVGRTTTALSPEGKVFVRGEYWNASADTEVAEGEAVEITGVDGLLLHVRPANPG
jgi:membrane-bound serine protease (ClpP class)